MRNILYVYESFRGSRQYSTSDTIADTKIKIVGLSPNKIVIEFNGTQFVTDEVKNPNFQVHSLLQKGDVIELLGKRFEILNDAQTNLSTLSVIVGETSMTILNKDAVGLLVEKE